jgi:hypothetical protein
VPSSERHSLPQDGHDVVSTAGAQVCLRVEVGQQSSAPQRRSGYLLAHMTVERAQDARPRLVLGTTGSLDRREPSEMRREPAGESITAAHSDRSGQSMATSSRRGWSTFA